MSLTLWFGPVAGFQFDGGVFPSAPGSKTYNWVVHDNAESAALLAKWQQAAPGRFLPGLLQEIGEPEQDIFIGSFSAGHGLAKPILNVDSDRALVRAVLLADSMYTNWKGDEPNPPEGYVKFGVDAAQKGLDKLFVSTASNYQAGQYPSGTQTMYATLQEIEKRVGASFGPAVDWPPIVPPPDGANQLGGTIFADYLLTVPHAQHATKLAPQLWSTVLPKWLEERGKPVKPVPVPVSPGGEAGGGIFALVVIGILALVAAFGGKRRA